MDSYEILGVSRDSSDKEIEVAYLDLKKKYDPSFNTSIHAYKKYREILRAYENIRDEQRRKMYDLKDNDIKKEIVSKEYELYDFNVAQESLKEESIDYSKVEDISLASYKDIEVKVEASYLYYLLNLRYYLEYYHKVKCKDCNEFTICDTCDGKKVVKYQEKLIYCPVCKGEGKVSVNCRTCGDTGFVLAKDNISFYVDEEIKEFKGFGDEYGNDTKSNLRVIFDFYDKDNIKVSEDLIEINYHLNKEETFNGVNKEFFSEFGAFKLEIPSFVENGYKKEIVFNNKKVVFTFFNEEYNGEDKNMYLFINRHYKDKYVYFSEDYSICSEEEKVNCNVMVKCSSRIVIENKGEEGKYGGNNGNLIINVIFNNDDELQYVSNVKVIHTNKIFNILGGRIEGVNHFGFKKENALIKKDDVYYLLTGDSTNKLKLKNYFIFKVLSIILWCLLPILLIVIPYSQTMFIVFISVMLVYLIISNVLMELEV